VLLVIGVIVATPNLLTGQQSPASGTPVHMVVTAEARHGVDVPVIQREDVMVYQDRDRVKTIDWIPSSCSTMLPAAASVLSSRNRWRWPVGRSDWPVGYALRALIRNT